MLSGSTSAGRCRSRQSALSCEQGRHCRAIDPSNNGDELSFDDILKHVFGQGKVHCDLLDAPVLVLQLAELFRVRRQDRGTLLVTVDGRRRSDPSLPTNFGNRCTHFALLDDEPPLCVRKFRQTTLSDRICEPCVSGSAGSRKQQSPGPKATHGAMARRIAQFPATSINVCKQIVYELIDKPIDDALSPDPCWLYPVTVRTAAIKRFAIANEQGLGHVIKNGRRQDELFMDVQAII